MIARIPKKPLNHQRMAPKLSAKPNAAERRHFERVAQLPCLVSGEWPVTLHHTSASIHGGRTNRSHRHVVPLAARYHLIQHGARESVEALSHRGFFEAYGIDLEAEAIRLELESVEMGILK